MYCDVIMNNDRPPASKLRKWLMGNKESPLPGLIYIYIYTVSSTNIQW